MDWNPCPLSAYRYVCCSVLQCATVSYSVLQCVAACCSALQDHVAHANAGGKMVLNPCRFSAYKDACCSVLQCVAVCGSVLQCAAVCCSVLRGVCTIMSHTRVQVAKWCRILAVLALKGMRVAVCCSVLQCVAMWCNVVQCCAVWCSVVQCVAVCCSIL